MDFLGSTDWLGLAMKMNQASLLPFLGFLYLLSKIPDAPKLSVRGFYMYLVFIAVGIPASIYCKTVLGTSMANVDYIHGPCEMLLTLANLFIVLGLIDAIQARTAAAATTTANGNSFEAAIQPPAAAAATAASAAAAGIEAGIKHHPAAGSSHDPLDDIQYMQSLHNMYSTKQTTGSTSSSTMDLESHKLHRDPLGEHTSNGSYPASYNALPQSHMQPMLLAGGMRRVSGGYPCHRQPFTRSPTADRMGASKALGPGRPGNQQYFTPARLPARSLLRVHGSPAAPVTAPARVL